MTVNLLSVAKLPPLLDQSLQDRYNFIRLSEVSDSELESLSPSIRAIAANGESVVPGSFMARFPNVEILSVFGVGYDGIDVPSATEQGIIVTNTPDVLTDDVADHAIALLLSIARQVPQADRFLRADRWPNGGYPFTRKVTGARLGIVGLGRIGVTIARRAEAFGMDISYTSRQKRDKVPYLFHDDFIALAKAVDFLIVTTFGGESTRHLINADVLDALGPHGFLINVARGSVVDEATLIEYLQDGRIAGAALDVFETEPNVPQALRALPNVVLTPHMASATHETRAAMSNLFLANLEAHFSGAPIPARVPQ
ncbi:2-hydroxyacid dehydrogenase [Paenirhodobacter populi]|uniref:2-hydroxyacid dehydrogenase n=1 Tax=Paenirhodobacter populi TaxID=2306993 RepID=A0A443J9X5_9RHOB|nr:2-hydroxyacid dehydrogenase [Sinirhodobacter populi]RWR17323.1 2-hydroxyacid dehydrogenase [Sinirhodobacter populi]